MSAPQLPVIQSDLLRADGVAHAFFTRQGGVSGGVYATLNGGAGSSDDPAAVAQNKALMAQRLGVAADALLIPYQVHSALAVEATARWDERPRCDGVATATPGLALGVTGADCGIVLFCDPRARVIAAAHAGWKGALDGVLEATLASMERLGAARSDVRAVLGPTIAAASYEVGPEFRARFVAADAANAAYFAPSPKDGHSLFDLPAYMVASITLAENIRAALVMDLA